MWTYLDGESSTDGVVRQVGVDDGHTHSPEKVTYTQRHERRATEERSGEDLQGILMRLFLEPQRQTDRVIHVTSPRNVSIAFV